MTEQVDITKHKKLTIKKKIFFSLIVLVLFLLSLELLSYAALCFLCVPVPRNIGGDAYMAPDPDLGWVLAPGASHHIVKYPQGYDITIRTGNGFRKDGQDIRSVRDCDIITIGDSHTFGFGLKDTQTLSFQLHRLLSDGQWKCLVFNGGVPSYGLDQYYLRLRSLGRLAEGSLVIVYINPINDIRNLSRDIDYGSPRPYAYLAEDGVEYVRPILYDPEISFHFSPDFDSLNQAFNVSIPTAPPTAVPMFQKNQTWQLFSGLRDKKFRVLWSQIEPTEAIDSYQDGWQHEQDYQRYVRRQLLQFAAGQWPEISEFESERRVAEEMLFRIFCDMKRHVESQQAHLLVVVAEEAYGNQGYWMRTLDILKQQLPQYKFEDGWSREAVKRAAQKANLPFLMADYPADRIESMFIPYDAHTSAEGFSFTAQRIVEWMEEKQFAFMDGKRSLDALVQEYPDINRLDGNGYARLHYAVQNGQYQAAEQLIAKGADINAKDRWGETPLYIAASRGHKSIVETLLGKGADINAADHRGQTPLHQSVQSGQDEVAELLIAEGADINVKNNDGRTPLEIALSRNHKEIVELLVANGAEVTSIHAAAKLGDANKVTACLERGTDVNAKDENGQTALHIAASNKHKDIAELLTAKGADVNAKDKWGYTPLYYSIWNEDEDKDLTGLLVSKGADVSLTAEKDYPPIYYAVWNEDLDTVKLLVANGARFDVKDQDGWTAFRYAAWQGNRELVEFFVSKGANVSGIHGAACVGDLDRVKGFVEKGTDVDTKDGMGWTALYWAASTGRRDVVEFLIAEGANVDTKAEDKTTPLHQAARAGDRKIVELFISKGANVNAKDKRGNTPLHGAASAGHREVVELLIARGANVNAKGRNAWTPLHNGARSGHKGVVEMLVRKGADVNAKDNQGRTPLCWAKNREHTEIVELLLKHGAKE
jgi:ankyrin repeat protein